MNLHFVVPGFSKCGTTSLCSMLSEHPDIFISSLKEPAFFAYNYELGWEWYEKFFVKSQEGQLCGEGTTFYTNKEFADESCERMLSSFPDLKFIFITRNPISRLESSFREMHHSGHKYGIDAPYEIGECVRELPNMIADTLYWSRLNSFRSRVPDERIHHLFLEDMKKNPQQELEKCFKFLGVEPQVLNIDKAKKLNPASDKLYDSSFYRKIKSNNQLRRVMKNVKPKTKDYLAKSLHLRRPFRSQVQWNPVDLEWVLEQIIDDVHAYLDWCNEPVSRWDLDKLLANPVSQKYAA